VKRRISGGGVEIKEEIEDSQHYAHYLVSGLISQYLFTGRLIPHDWCNDYIRLVFIDGLNDAHIRFYFGEAINLVLDEEKDIKKIAGELLRKKKLSKEDIHSLLNK
jgi:hypothetical protein